MGTGREGGEEREGRAAGRCDENGWCRGDETVVGSQGDDRRTTAVSTRLTACHFAYTKLRQLLWFVLSFLLSPLPAVKG